MRDVEYDPIAAVEAVEHYQETEKTLNTLDKMGDQLKPCPFCGGAAAAFHNAGGYWHVGCLPCDAEGPPKFEKQEAIDGWNARP